MAIVASIPTPSSHAPAMNMNSASLPSLPIELLSTWQTWRPPKHDSAISSPLDALPPRRVLHPHQHNVPTLPPIHYLDRHISRHSPITPPQTDDTAQWHTCGDAELRLPPMWSHSPVVDPLSPLPHSNDQPQAKQSPAISYFDWLTPSTHRPAHFVAEKVSEMICYLWFSTLSHTATQSKRSRLLNQDPSSYIPKPSPDNALLQYAVSPAFVRFMQKLLETTQVSQSVIVLALHYIYRLKISNPLTAGQAGSEYRVAVAAFMLANKFVDDNTYTNKTWSEVSGIDLPAVNTMEREFLLGIDFDLYVDKNTYDVWLNLLRGLVMAKERESKQWRYSRSGVRIPHHPHHHRAHHASSHSNRHHRHHRTYHRARSTSPTRTSVTYPFSAPAATTTTPSRHQPPSIHTQFEDDYSTPPPAKANAKRTASDAFSPTSASFPPIKKRPIDLSLDIPELTHTAPSTASSISPSEPLLQHGFAHLSINNTSPIANRNAAAPSPATSSVVSVDGQRSAQTSPVWLTGARHYHVPETLISAYRVDADRPFVAPQQLYFYSLAGSPTDLQDDPRDRKARLRYHQPTVPSTQSYHVHQPTMPMVVQSACASPHDMHVLPSVQTLPNFHESDRWTTRHTQPCQPQAQSQYYSTPPAAVTNHVHHSGPPPPPTTTSSTATPHYHHPQPNAHTQYASPQPQPSSHHQYASPVPPAPHPASHYNTHPQPHSHHQSPVVVAEQHHQPQPQGTTASIPAAPFANAGPPGIQFYSHSHTQQQVQQQPYNHYSHPYSQPSHPHPSHLPHGHSSQYTHAHGHGHGHVEYVRTSPEMYWARGRRV